MIETPRGYNPCYCPCGCDLQLRGDIFCPPCGKVMWSVTPGALARHIARRQADAAA